MGVTAALALTAANARRIVDAFRKERALNEALARPLRKLGLSDSRTLRQMVVSTIIRKAGSQRYFLDETVWAHRRQLRWRTVARTLIVIAIVAAAAALYLLGR
jgi:hypothetical protein